MTVELSRSLLLSGAVSSEKLGEALYAVVTQGIPLARALVGMGAVDEARLEEELARSQPQVLRKVVPLAELMDRLPHGLCHRLGAAPVRLDERSGTVEVAVLDPRDPHAADEIGYHLQTPARAVRASYRALQEALEAYPQAARALAPPMGAPGLEKPLRAAAQPPASKLPPSLPNAAIPLTRRTSGKPPLAIASAMSPISRGPNTVGAAAVGKTQTGLGDAASRIESIHELDPEDVKFSTRVWDDAPTSEPGWAEEQSWEVEPVFELRRLGPPPTVPEPEPPTVRMTAVPEEASEAFRLPPPARVPFAVNAPSPPYPDVGTTLAGIRAAADRDAVLALVQAGVRTVARRVALLVVKKDGMAGWSCTPEFGDEAALKQLKIPIRAPNLLTAVISGGVHLGPLMGTFAAPLLRVMSKPSRDVAMAAVRVGERPAVLIVADELGDTMLATKRIDDLAKAAGEGLLRVLRTKKE